VFDPRSVRGSWNDQPCTQLVEDLETISHSQLAEDLRRLEKMSGIANVVDSIPCWESVRESWASRLNIWRSRVLSTLNNLTMVSLVLQWWFRNRNLSLAICEKLSVRLNIWRSRVLSTLNNLTMVSLVLQWWFRNRNLSLAICEDFLRRETMVMPNFDQPWTVGRGSSKIIENEW